MVFFINCYHYCPVIISDTNQHYLFFLDRIKENETNDLVVIIHFINFAYGIWNPLQLSHLITCIDEVIAAGFRNRNIRDLGNIQVSKTLWFLLCIRYYFAFSQEPRKLYWNNKHDNNMWKVPRIYLRTLFHTNKRCTRYKRDAVLWYDRGSIPRPPRAKRE